MIPVVSRNSQHIAVFGLGASGRATAHALTAGGGTVTAWDDNADSRKATNANMSLRPGYARLVQTGCFDPKPRRAADTSSAPSRSAGGLAAGKPS